MKHTAFERQKNDNINTITTFDPAQWKPQEYPLFGKFVDFARVCNCVVTDQGKMQGWFSEALWRTDVYAPFNGRVLENYYSLAFFYGCNAPWNIYHGDVQILKQLDLVLNYVFGLMREDGAIPEYNIAALDRPMLASSSFGAMYMSFTLEVAGKTMPAAMAKELYKHSLSAARFALSDEHCYLHATSFSNQILGAMTAAAKLARLNNDAAPLSLLNRAGEALLGEFMSPTNMGFLYEQDGADTFSYFLTTLWCLTALYQEWPDERVLEVLRRHGAWMSRWILPEPDGKTMLISTGHQTRSPGGHRLPNREYNGLGKIMQSLLSGQTGDEDERRFLALLLLNKEKVAKQDRLWEAAALNPLRSVATERNKATGSAYKPVNPLLLYPRYAPAKTMQKEIMRTLPCLEQQTGAENLVDKRGNQYIFVRQPGYYMGFAYQAHWSQAHEGPQFLWLDKLGTIALSANCGRGGWETVIGEIGTSRENMMAHMRKCDVDAHEITVKYSKIAQVEKTYTLRPGSVNVGLYAPWTGGRKLSERIPFLLHKTDTIHVDYGCAPTPCIEFRTITRTVAIERKGMQALSLELPSPILVSFKPIVCDDNYIKTMVSFEFPGIIFNRTGYRLLIGTEQNNN